MATDCIVQAGGPALNAAITFSFLGGHATLVSACGHTPLGQIVEDEMERYGVEFVNCQAGNPQTSQAVNSQGAQAVDPPISSIILNSQNGSRTIFNSPDPGVEGRWIARPVPAADMLLLDGFYIPQLRDVIEQFAGRKRPICLDAGGWKEGTGNLLPYVSIAICSERFLPPGVLGASDVMAYLHDQGVAQVAITRGSQTILGSDRGQRFSLAVAPCVAVDTLGAGDIFHGAFCWYYLAGSSFEDALQQASLVASQSCRYLGARRWMETFSPPQSQLRL